MAKLEARVLNRTLKHKPKDGSTHWSSRKLAAELGDVSFSAVQRIWRKHGFRWTYGNVDSQHVDGRQQGLSGSFTG